MRRGLTALLAGVVCMALAACSTIPEGMETEPPGNVTAPSATDTAPPEFALGCLEGDSLNPYLAETAVNRSLSPLLYESLYVLDDTLLPRPALAADTKGLASDKPATSATASRTAAQTTAQTAADTAAGTTAGTTLLMPHTVTEVPERIQITLRKNARFSDGTAVTGADVEASFALARQSARYQGQLSAVASVKAQGSTGVVVTLSAPDVQYAARLTFPIVKAGTAESDRPIGSGPYYADKTGESLLANAYAPEKPVLTAVKLKTFQNSDALRHALGTGQIVLYADDLADGEIPRVTTASSPLSTSHLVFVGFNSARAALTPAVRRAVNSAIDRNELINAAFAGYAEAALSPFHPRWGGTQQTLFAPKGDTETALSLLEEAGYRTAEGSANKKELSLTLLCSTGSAFRLAAAGQIKEALAAVGVTVTVTELGYKEYLEQLKKGNYDLYIGEIRLTDDLDLSPLLTGAAAYGVKGHAGTYYGYYRAGTATVGEFLTGFEQELPFLPLCYRYSLVAYHRQLQNVRFSGFGLFSHIQDWSIQK